MKQSHWLLCVAKNCDWSRKIMSLLVERSISDGGNLCPLWLDILKSV